MKPLDIHGPDVCEVLAALRRTYRYEPGNGLFYRKIDGTANNRAGDVAGSVKKDGYIDIYVGTRSYKAHRLAWIWTYGRFPKLYIDHINGRKTDNRIVNLREASDEQNVINRRKSDGCLSRFKGVTFHRNTQKWQAQIGYKRRSIYLGLFETEQLASLAYDKAAADLHGDFVRLEGRS